jgi:hypothetical protein
MWFGIERECIAFHIKTPSYQLLKLSWRMRLCKERKLTFPSGILLDELKGMQNSLRRGAGAWHSGRVLPIKKWSSCHCMDRHKSDTTLWHSSATKYFWKEGLWRRLAFRAYWLFGTPTEWLNNWDVRGQLPAAETRVWWQANPTPPVLHIHSFNIRGSWNRHKRASVPWDSISAHPRNKELTPNKRLHK